MSNTLGFHYLLRGPSRPKKSVQLDQGWPRNLVGLSLVAAITLFSPPTLTSGHTISADRLLTCYGLI